MDRSLKWINVIKPNRSRSNPYVWRKDTADKGQLDTKPKKENCIKKKDVIKSAPHEDFHWLLPFRGSDISNNEIVKPCRRDDEEDVHGINSIIDELMNEEEEISPVKQVLRSVVKVVHPSRSTRYSGSESYNEEETVEPLGSAHHSSINSSTKVTVGNLALSVDQEDLDELFQEYKGVLKVSLNTDTKGRSLGTGYALFSTRTEALKSVSTLNGVPLDDQPIKMSVFRMNQRKSVFSRMSNKVPMASISQPKDKNKKDYTSDESPNSLDYPRKSVFSRLSKEPDHQHRPRKSVFSRLSNLKSKASLQVQNFNKPSQKVKARELQLSTKKRYRDKSPESGSFNGNSHDNQCHHRKPYAYHRDRRDNMHTYKRRKIQSRDISPDNYGPPDVKLEYQELLLKYSNSRNIDSDNPQYQEKPSRSHSFNQGRKSNSRDHSRHGSIKERIRNKRHRVHRPTAEELDAELEEIINSKIDTDVFGQ